MSGQPMSTWKQIGALGSKTACPSPDRGMSRGSGSPSSDCFNMRFSRVVDFSHSTVQRGRAAVPAPRRCNWACACDSEVGRTDAAFEPLGWRRKAGAGMAAGAFQSSTATRMGSAAESSGTVTSASLPSQIRVSGPEARHRGRTAAPAQPGPGGGGRSFTTS